MALYIDRWWEDAAVVSLPIPTQTANNRLKVFTQNDAQIHIMAQLPSIIDISSDNLHR